jgi:cytochrome c-type biogenesis protein CcmE
VDFVMSDGTSRLPVVATGGVPSLFAGGRGAVVEGAMTTSGVFRADAVLVKHSSVYKPPAPGSTPHYADLGG